jgi:hypothetical protein
VIGEQEMLGISNLVDLKIEKERIPGVLQQLNRIEHVAQAVMAVPLAPEDELGPEWRP